MSLIAKRITGREGKPVSRRYIWGIENGLAASQLRLAEYQDVLESLIKETNAIKERQKQLELKKKRVSMIKRKISEEKKLVIDSKKNLKSCELPTHAKGDGLGFKG